LTKAAIRSRVQLKALDIVGKSPMVRRVGTDELENLGYEGGAGVSARGQEIYRRVCNNLTRSKTAVRGGRTHWLACWRNASVSELVAAASGLREEINYCNRK